MTTSNNSTLGPQVPIFSWFGFMLLFGVLMSGLMVTYLLFNPEFIDRPLTNLSVWMHGETPRLRLKIKAWEAKDAAYARSDELQKQGYADALKQVKASDIEAFRDSVQTAAANGERSVKVPVPKEDLSQWVPNIDRTAYWRGYAIGLHSLIKDTAGVILYTPIRDGAFSTPALCNVDGCHIYLVW